MNLFNFNKTVPFVRKKGIKGYFQIIFHSFFDLVLLNFIFVLTSLPIVTIGASYKALVEVLNKYAEDENVYPIREYFLNFKKEFLKSSGYGILFLFTFFIIAFSCNFYLNLAKENIIFLLFACVSLICLILLTMIFGWFFPLFTKIDQKLSALIINSFILSFKFIKSTLCFLAVVLICFCLIFAFFPYSLPVIFILPFVLIALASSCGAAEKINEVFDIKKD